MYESKIEESEQELQNISLMIVHFYSFGLPFFTTGKSVKKNGTEIVGKVRNGKANSAGLGRPRRPLQHPAGRQPLLRGRRSFLDEVGAASRCD